MIEGWLMIYDKESGQKRIAPLGTTFGTICLGAEFILSSKRPEVPHEHLFFPLGLPGKAREGELLFVAVKNQPSGAELDRFIRTYESASNIRDLEGRIWVFWLNVVLRPNQDGLLFI